jgi:cell division septal protein FtsQ
MPRKKKDTAEPVDEPRGNRAPGRRSLWPAIRFTALTLATVLTVFGAAFAAWTAEQAVLADGRFRFAPGDATTDQYVTVSGLHHASKASVLRVFNEDRDHSIARIDIDQRRLALQRVDWVKDATVRRIWPNRLAIEVVERTPVAFIEVPAAATGSFENPVSYTPAMMDAEGVVLHSRTPIQAELPLLVGVRESDRLEVRRDRILRMVRLLNDLSSYRSNVQEVDVSEPANLRIGYDIQGKLVVLILGEERFRERLELFLKHYPGIQDRVLPRSAYDVSLEGRVIAR